MNDGVASQVGMPLGAFLIDVEFRYTRTMGRVLEIVWYDLNRFRA